MACVVLAQWLYRRIHYVLVFNLAKVNLLRSQHRSRSCNSRPSDESLCTDFIVFHGVDPDQGASAAETSLTVNSNCASIRISEVLFTAFDEAVNYILGRNRAINEEEVLVLNSIFGEGILVIFGIVESDHF